MARLDIFPRKVDESPMDLATLLAALATQNVEANQVNQVAIEAALANALEVEVSQRDVPSATGIAAVPAEGWHIKSTAAKATGGVLPGQTIAMFAADVAPVDGLTVRGESIPVDHSPTLQPELGLGTRLSEDGTLIVAEHYGRPQVTRATARVEPGIRLAEDSLTCEVDLYAVDADGNLIEEGVILTLLSELGVADACIDKTALAQALAHTRDTGSSQRKVVLARGQPATEGQDGHLEPLFGPGAGCAMTGDELARVISSTPGTEGLDILGNVLFPEQNAADPAIQVGAGCEQLDDASIVATTYGEPILEGDHIQVSPGLHISENDLSVEIHVFHGRIGMRELRIADLLGVLTEAGIAKSLIDEPTLAQALQTARRTINTVPSVVAATSVPAKPPTPGKITGVDKLNSVALPGDELARVFQPNDGQPGLTVLGVPIEPPEPENPVRLIAVEGCSLDSQAALVTADVYGLVRVDSEKVYVESGIRFSEDSLSCVIDLVPERLDGTPFEVGDLQELLVAAGVPEERVDSAALEAGLIRSKKAGGILVEVQAARGRKATAGLHGQFKPLPELETGCVFAGTRLGQVIEAQAPADGIDVMGRKIPPQSGVTEVKLQARSGCTLIGEGAAVSADFYGLVEVELARVTERPGKPINRTEVHAFTVQPGFHIDEDRLNCQLDIYPYRAEGDVTRIEDLLTVLQRNGVQEHLFDSDSLESALEQALETATPQLGISAAKGIEPRHGRDGVRLIVGGELGQAGAKLAFGMFDYKDRAFFRQVAHGEAVAQVSPPTDGQSGNTLFGEALEARDGKILAQTTGPGVEVHDGVVYAARDGVLSIRADFIDVVDLVVIDGDVDYNTGHVHVDSGSVQISGSVLPGFVVEAPGDIEVGGIVDNAAIKAGGSVLVRGSILGGTEQGCNVVAGNNVFAKLVRDATVRAGGDITVQREAFNCELDMDGHLLMETKPGTLSGGTAHARAGARLYNLGSQQWVRTELRCGGEGRRIISLRETLDRYQLELKRFHKDFGTEPDKAILSRTSPRLKERTQARLLRRKQLFQEVRRIREELLDYEREAAQREPPTINVRENTYPKSLLKLGGSRMVVETELNRSHFWYDAEHGNIQRSPLGAQNQPEPPEASETETPDIQSVTNIDSLDESLAPDREPLEKEGDPKP